MMKKNDKVVKFSTESMHWGGCAGEIKKNVTEVAGACFTSSAAGLECLLDNCGRRQLSNNVHAVT
jgi:copper chaperone CopZ